MRNFLVLFIFLVLLNSCGDNDRTSKVTKGHRDSIKIQCEDSSNKEACTMEVKSNFIKDGNEYADFQGLNNDQIESVKWNCVRSRKYGLVSYNDCLLEYIDKAKGGNLFEEKIAKKPKNNIEKLEQSVVYIEVVLTNLTKKQELPLGSGSGVIVSKKEIATNCHVAMVEANEDDLKFAKKELNWSINSDKLKHLVWIRTINGEDWAEAKLIKKNERKDICILKHNPKDLFKVSMKPVERFGSFEKLKKAEFVRAMGSPGGMIGFTSEGTIQWLGTGEALNRNFGYQLLEDFDKDTKFIIHGAKIHQGSSGGPLFDSDGKIIGLNTLISDTAAENVAVSADHIKDLLYNK